MEREPNIIEMEISNKEEGLYEKGQREQREARDKQLENRAKDSLEDNEEEKS